MKTRAALLLALTLASLLALTACGGGGASSASTSNPAATATPIATTLYTSKDGAYSVKYPSTWKATEQSFPSTAAPVVISSPDGNDVCIIQPLTVHSTASAPTILKSAIGDANTFTDSKVDSATTTQTLPSGTWTVATGTTTLKGTSTTGNARLYMTEHGGHTVVITILVSTAMAGEHQTKYFDPMLTSFTFLK